MSAFSSDSGRIITDRTKTGFLKKDIDFLKVFGGTQASHGGKTNISVERNGKRESVGNEFGKDITETVKGSVNQQTAKEFITTKGGSRSGPAFKDISDISEQEIEKLFNLFQKREDSISKRRKTPGIKQTRLVDR